MDQHLYQDLIEIKLSQQRILNDHEDFKEAFDNLNNKFSNVVQAIHKEELARQLEDSVIKESCREDVRTIYKNVAISGLVCVSGLIGGILLFLANK